jgi:2-polyprenyl-3-methyl-5-hydroxy-6-metoxy-1,4-benzoquinol methylase
MGYGDLFLGGLAHRQRQPELMDQAGLDPHQHRRALHGLARINRISASAAIVWRPIQALAQANPGRPLRVLDVATGGGDVPIALWRRAHAAGIPLELCGVDVSDTAVSQARDTARQAGAEAEFLQLDVLHAELPADFDVITTSLFLHHLDEADAVLLLRKMAQATRRLVLVNDLIRSRLGYLAAYFGTRLLSRSPVVHVDGPRSVEGAFTMSEARALAEQAGLHGADLSWRWPWRFLLVWRRPA